MKDFREMKSIDLNDPIFDKGAIVECYFGDDYEVPWDPDWHNVCIDVDLNKKPLYKYLYYPAVYEGEVIQLFFSEYPKKDSFAFLKTMKQPSKTEMNPYMKALCIFMCIALALCTVILLLRAFYPSALAQ